ncbi:MAG: KpsF/GutQ family sugar-phosphate isomerase [Candidatus Delongbacteria bacterium]|jgi:arabinose-5-phosphate isomerase|nr:KpsF/GutQ family sugar-phosphate isomerase [Candidatus Delongbacteria bacterium]
MKQSDDSYLSNLAKKVFDIEIDALKKVKKNLDNNFIEAINLIMSTTGKVVVTGMGKSGLIARKIAATLSSTGTLAIYMHPAEGIHGDLGVVEKKDVMIILGKSGEVNEILSLLPALRNIGCKVISITGNTKSTLAKNSDIVLNTEVDREACSLNLAPTSSTTAALVMGDALSTVLSDIKEFKEENFALFHPGGALGKRLLLKVDDFIHPLEEVAICSEKDDFREVIIRMNDKNLGACLIIENEKLNGIVTNGDIKRILLKHTSIENLTAGNIMTSDPKSIDSDMLAYDAIRIIEKSGSFTVMPVIKDGKPIGLIKLHDILNAGL